MSQPTTIPIGNAKLAAEQLRMLARYEVRPAFTPAQLLALADMLDRVPDDPPLHEQEGR